MKIFNKFIWSKKEPSNKNDIWFDGSTWKVYTEEAWQSFTLPVDAADKVAKVIENASEVYQEKLNAGYGIIIEGNTISVDDSNVWEAIETLQQNKVEQTQLDGYVPLDRYSSTSQVLMDNISELTSTKLNKTDVATINGKSLTEGGNITIEGGESHNIGSIDLFEQIIAQKQNHDLTLEDKEAILNGKVITASTGNGAVPAISITSIEGLGLMLMFHFNERLYSMCVMWNNDRCYINGFFSFSRYAKFFADEELSETSENAVQNKVVTEKLAELSAEVEEQTNFIERGSEISLQNRNGIIAAADGRVVDGSQYTDYLYTNDVPVEVGMKFNIDTNGLTLSWSRVFFYQDSTFVKMIELGTSPTSYTLPELAQPYNGVRFNFSISGGFSSVNAVVVKTISLDELVPIKNVVKSLNEATSELQHIILGDQSTSQYAVEDFTRNGMLFKSGIVANEFYYCTELIDIARAKTINIQNVYSNEHGVLGYALYMEDGKTLVQSNDLPSEGGEYSYVLANIPTQAKYLVCCRYVYSQVTPSITITYVTESLVEEVEQLKKNIGNNETEALVTETWRQLQEQDVELTNYGFYLTNNSIEKTSDNIRSFIYFKENVKAIEFEVGDLLDANSLSIILGVGKDSNSNDCVAYAWMPSESRSETDANVRNISIDEAVTVSAEQTNSISGLGRMTTPYRNPENPIGKYQKGDICRIENRDGFIVGSIKTQDGWKKWFTCDTNGNWVGGASRFGWNKGIRLGFITRFLSSTAGVIAKNIKVINDTDNQFISFCYNTAYDIKQRGKWLAIGDSITAINDNNGLSYVGFAERLYGFNCINKGEGGWTIYKMWRNRSEVGWESDVESLPKSSIVTILMGTNDFDTTFTTPKSDEEMDSMENPHPRFGTEDGEAEDAKDSHTTLGCLRLIIERIYELNPSVKIAVFAPFYRTQKGVENGQFSELIVNAEGRTIYDYADAIVKVASEYNIPAFNTCRECGINKLTLEAYTYDNLHINENGGELIGKYVGSKLSNL